ncbi:MAG: exodeoxyribonuclease VII small subunit [Eubacterium sp.]|nr:exodeoxyribonuclease VII small subunit [Eubacterium sp.]
MPAKKTGKTEPKDISIEESFARLEEIIQTLESPETGLEDAMKLYTEGVELLGSCQKTLEGVEQQLKILQPEDGTDGSV